MKQKRDTILDLPFLRDNQYIRHEVNKRIKNKIQPLALKFFVFRQRKTISDKQNIQVSHGPTAQHVKKRFNRQTVHYTSLQKRQRQNRIEIDIKINKRRRGIAKPSILDQQYRFNQIKTKVQHHIMLKRMNILQNEFEHAQEYGKKLKQQLYKRLFYSPIQKYVKIFQKNAQLPSIIGHQHQNLCEQMLKQIKSQKNIKLLEYMQQNMNNLTNNQTTKQTKNTNKTKPKQISKNIQLNKSSITKLIKQQKRLKQEIKKDIQKQYQIQGASKIRININHKKMIQIL